MHFSNEIQIDVGSRRKLNSLIASSYKNEKSYMQSIPWSYGVNDNLLPKNIEYSWVYGTEIFNSFSRGQVKELLWLENARDISIFVELEEAIPHLYMGYVNKYKDSLDPYIYEYLLIFSKEEISHTLAFKKYLNMASLPTFMGKANSKFWVEKLPNFPPILGIMYTLMAEWITELGALHNTQSDDIDPLTKSLYYNHHLEEVRHIAFGKMVIESFIKNSSETDQLKMCKLVEGFVDDFVSLYTFTPDVNAYLSFDLSFTDPEKEIIKNTHNQELNSIRFKDIYCWINKLSQR